MENIGISRKLRNWVKPRSLRPTLFGSTRFLIGDFYFIVISCRWEELGRYDLPASIDYVLKTTGHQKVSYVGYSLGCAVFYVGANLRPDLNDKIEVMISLAPTSTVQRLDNAFKLIAPFSTPLKVILILKS